MDFERASTAALIADLNARPALTLEAGDIGTWRWDSIHDLVVADTNLARMFGVSAQESRGAPLALYTRAIHPEDRERVEREIGQCVRDGGAYEVEYRLNQRDGSVRWILARGRPELNASGAVVGLPGVLFDITEHVRTEQVRQSLVTRIEHQARILDTALSSITDFAYIFDRQGRFAYANQALLSLWGLDLADVLGKNFFDLNYPDDLAARLMAQIQQVFDTGDIVRDETAYTSPTGSTGYFEYIFAPVQAVTGEIEVVAGSTRDITDRKHLQEENARLLLAERAARAESERLGRVKDEFLATLSHELRTPLNAILGWVQLLARSESARGTKGIMDGLAIIERNAQVQKELIDDLLDMSRIVSGKERLEMRDVHMARVIEAAVRTVEPTANAKGVQVITTLDSATPLLRGDESRLQQIVWNLLTNAVKFTPAGGRVDIVLMHAASGVELTVTDTGVGMDAHFLPYAFDRFRQVETSTTRAQGGLGLGLSIVKKLVELHGGRVEARSAGPGTGSTFVVFLPLPPAREPEPPRPDDGQAHEPAAAYAPTLLQDVRVLVVDDDPDGRTLVGRLLEEHSATIALAGSVEEALQLVAGFQPHVLLSDIGMPQTDGYDLIRRVRSLGGRAGTIPAAALTARARPEDRARALLSGYQAHISKPIDTRELIGAVAALAGRS